MAKAAKKITDSKRMEVIITRKYGEEKHKIFASTTIMKNGRKVLEQFRIPVDVKVSLPVEIIRIIRDRKVAKFENNEQKMVNEFSIQRSNLGI